jgi:transcription termination factor Rho
LKTPKSRATKIFFDNLAPSIPQGRLKNETTKAHDRVLDLLCPSAKASQ